MKVLQVTHGYPPDDVAGVELCTQWLAQSLVELGHEVQVFCRCGDPGSPEFATRRDQDGAVSILRINNNFQVIDPSGPYFYFPQVESVFTRLLAEFRPDAIHVHHLAGLSASIVDVVRKKGIPYFVTLHDYWYACPRVHLLTSAGELCDGPEGGTKCVTACYNTLVPYRFQRVKKWVAPFRALLSHFSPPRISLDVNQLYVHRYHWLISILENAELCICPSTYVRKKYSQWGIPLARLRVIPHGLPQLKTGSDLENFVSGTSETKLSRSDSTFTVGFFGTVMRHKGIHVLWEALEQIPESLKVEVWGKVMQQTRRKVGAHRINYHGRYSRAELGSLMSKVDVVVIPSIWPETFNIVLREAWQSGIPVIASRCGALGEAIDDKQNGYLFEPGNARQLANLIQQAVSGRLKKPTVRETYSPLAYAREIEAVYRGSLD